MWSYDNSKFSQKFISLYIMLNNMVNFYRDFSIKAIVSICHINYKLSYIVGSNAIGLKLKE